jgi:hypothetical protein
MNPWWRKAAAVIAFVAGLLPIGCATTTTIISPDPSLRGIPAGSGLAFGRIRLEGGRKTILAGNDSQVEFEFLNTRTRERLTYALERNGDFFLLLPAGDYAITSIWSGFKGVTSDKESSWFIFNVLPGRAVYLGTLDVQLPSADKPGEVAILDETVAATEQLKLRYPSLPQEEHPVKWLIYPAHATKTQVAAASGRRGSALVPVQTVNNVILVSVTLNRTHGATLLIDTGATGTLLTPGVAKRLGISPPADGRRRTILLLGGQQETVPVVQLSSLHIGDATVTDLEVGIYPIAPSVPIIDGILGNDFLGRFEMTIDHATRQLRLEPRQ